MSQAVPDRRRRLLAESELLAAELAEAEAALPAHSVRPWQMERVLELEERLDRVRRELAELTEGDPSQGV